MATETNIQWCDHTYNPWRGCRKVAPECANCYITTTVPFRTTGQTHGNVRVRAGEATLRLPLAWNRALEEHNATHGDNQRHKVFALSLGDWLDDEVPIKWLAELLHLIRETPTLDWLLLTKRAELWQERIEKAADFHFDHWDRNTCGWLHDWRKHGLAPSNVWIGVSAGADQAAALNIPARIHFLSCEPMLRPMDTTHAHRFNWIIFGGESGKDARPCDMDWIREGIAFCREHGIAPFVKQMGSACRWPGVAQKFKFKHKKGGDPSEWPEDLRVREFPSHLP